MATDRAYAFAPTYAFPPGDTLAEVLESRQMSQADLAERTGLTPKTVNEIVKGKAPVTPETALHFERVLGIPASFWNNLQRRFDERQAGEAETEQLKGWVAWAKQFPLRELAKWRWIQIPHDRVEQVRCLLNFFGTARPDAWEGHWHTVQIAFRAAKQYEVDDYALACWLRQGEIEGSRIETAPYDEAAFRQALDNARAFTRLPGVEFVGQLVREFSTAGVAVVFVPELPGVRTYGATRWLSPQKALIQLSLRRKSDDELWFTLFHEAAHILFHPKRAVFLEREGGTDTLEEEANRFAGDHLIPPAAYRAFLDLGLITAATVEAFADEIGIAPGVVVGRLQHDKHIPYSMLNRLKRRYRFSAETDK